MLGLDDKIASISGGASVGMAILVAVLLGLRHATDPDHLAAVTSLVAGGRERTIRSAARLGAFWGLGHAVTLFAFGLPIVVLNGFLPDRVQQAAEAAIALLIVFLAVRLLRRWRTGCFHVHEHEHSGVRHAHLHSHGGATAHRHRHDARTPLGAFGIGLVHGMSGSAGVGLLLLAAVESAVVAVVCLALLALLTGVSMTVLSSGFGLALTRRGVRGRLNRVAPALGLGSLAFGVWYGLGVLHLAPYAI